MSSPRYDAISNSLSSARSLAWTAMRNDVVENFLVLSRLENLGQTIRAPWIAAEAVGLWISINSRLTAISAHHAWLGASRRSPDLLGEAAGQWGNVVQQQEQIVATVRANKGRIRNSEWTGDGQDSHVADVTRKERKELAFAESVERIVTGCKQARMVTNMLLERAVTMCATTELQCAVARTGPSATSPRARNWRMRKVEAILGQLETRYAALHRGDGWKDASLRIATIFDENAETLRMLHTMPGGPLRMTAV